MKLNNDLLSRHTFLKLNAKKGYSTTQCSEAMQLMEVWSNLLVVKCKDGCLELPQDHFEIIKPKDYSKFKTFHIAPYFANNFYDYKINN